MLLCIQLSRQLSREYAQGDNLTRAGMRIEWADEVTREFAADAELRRIEYRTDSGTTLFVATRC